MSNGPQWFAPKKHGFGSGPPIAWQGWVLLIGYVLAILAMAPLVQRSLLAFLSATTVLTALFLFICAKTTAGGWRRRS